MNRKELIEGVAMLLEDAAALGSPAKARNAAAILTQLSVVAKRRATAIKFRLDGEIKEALYYERKAEETLHALYKNL